MFRYSSVAGFFISLAVTAPAVLADDPYKTVFVTSVAVAGDFGGIEKADAICQGEADSEASIVPLGTYLAWLSDGVESPATRFAKATVPYVLTDGTVIAKDYADLTDGSLMHPINMESSGVHSGGQYVWTGTKPDGVSAPDYLTCDQWAAEPLTSFHGMGGTTDRKGSLWSSRIARVDCGREYRLWCFQQ